MVMHNVQMFNNVITFHKHVVYFKLLMRFPAEAERFLRHPCVKLVLEGLLIGIKAAEA
jgi:hypothetical protein